MDNYKFSIDVTPPSLAIKTDPYTSSLSTLSASWEGEEEYDFHNDRDEKFTPSGELCHHFQKFPRTERGKMFFDTIFQVELQKVGQYHIHYKNLRIELGKNRVKQMAKALQDTVNDMS